MNNKIIKSLINKGFLRIAIIRIFINYRKKKKQKMKQNKKAGFLPAFCDKRYYFLFDSYAFMHAFLYVKYVFLRVVGVF